MSKRRFLALLCWTSVFAAAILFVSPGVFHAAPQTSAGGYHVIRTILLGGEGSWDYLSIDPQTKRIYIPRTNDVMVVDEVSGKLIADMTQPGMAGLHEVRIAPEFNRGFVTGNEGTPPVPVVYLFDAKALTLNGKITFEGSPKGNDGGEYDPASKRFIAYTAMSNNMQMIDAKTGKVVGVKELPGRPEASLPDGKGNMFVQVSDHSTILEFDTKTLETKHEWPSNPCDRGSSLAFDKVHHRLFLGCRAVHEVANLVLPKAVDKDLFVVMDSETGKVITSMPIAIGTDGAGYDPGSGDIFFTNRDSGDGKSTLVNIFHEDSPDKYSKVGDVQTLYGARTMALDERTHHIFLVTTAENTPGVATPQNPNPGPRPVANTFTLIEIGK